MATPLVGILGQQAPGAAANADVYTTPAGRRCVGSTLVACNTSPNPTTIRVYARIAGAAAAVGNAVVYDMPINGNAHIGLTEGITLAPTDKLTAQSAAGTVTFTLFGIEEDVA